VVTITLTPACPEMSPRGGAFFVRTITTPECLAWAVEQTTRGISQQLGLP